MSWLSQLIFGKDPAPTQNETSFQGSIDRTGAAADAADARYRTDTASFDPRTAYKEYASGAYGDFQKNLGESLRELSGKSVGAGRFDSGFFDENQGEVVRGLGSDFSNRLAQGAIQTAGMRQQQIGQEGQYALGQGGMYNDLLAGQLDRETAKANAKKERGSGFLNRLATAASFIS